MRKRDRVLHRLQRWLSVHEMPVRCVLWNAGLSPPFELVLDAEATPWEHHQANVLLRSFDPHQLAADEQIDAGFRLRWLRVVG